MDKKNSDQRIIVNIIERVWKMELRDKRIYCSWSPGSDGAFDQVFIYRNNTELKLNEAENITFDNFLRSARSEFGCGTSRNFAPSLLSTLRINMEPVNLGYSTKNIPIAQPKEYLKCLVVKNRIVPTTRQMESIPFLKANTRQPEAAKETFGFNTTKSPPPIKELEVFESKMLSLVQRVRFKNHRNEFQNDLSQDLTKFRTDDKLFVAADKTTNFYRLDAPTYEKLLDTAITKTYKKAPTKATSRIVSDEKKIAKSLGIDNRVDSLAAKDSFITLKDHKPNFPNNPTCRLINPSKSEIGIISKQILQRINSNIVKSTNINQWKNTDAVINWCSNMPGKSTLSFIRFDIVDFYPSISEKLLNEALIFASQYDEITENEKAIIMKAKQSLLFNRSTTWRKRTSDSLFDVTMGSFDGAETCELVGSYLLSQLAAEYGNDIGLYRDDGLAAFDK